MTLYVSEVEMIERLADSLKKASDRAKEFMTALEPSKPLLFIEFINSLKVAAGSAHQLYHAQENPYWLNVRDKLEAVVEIGQQLPTFTGRQAGIWFSVKTSLDSMFYETSKKATEKALNRQEVLAQLDLREKNIKIDN